MSVRKVAQNQNKLAAHGFSEKAERDLDVGSDKLRHAFNDPGVTTVRLTRDEAGAIFLRMGQLEAMLFTATIRSEGSTRR